MAKQEMSEQTIRQINGTTKIPKQNKSSPIPHLLPPLGYLIVSLVATWPMLTHLQGSVPGIGDWGQNMWALWWTRYALLSLEQTPFFTNYLFYPEGITLRFHPLDVSDGLLAMPLYGLLGSDITYNLMIWLSFVLGGWGTYLLAHYLTGHRGASFVAGLIFVLSPYHFLRIELGHLNLSTIQWIPFYALFVLKFMREGRRLWSILAVFFLVINALNSWYYVIYCGLLSLAFIVWPEPTQPLKLQLLRRSSCILLVLALSILILSPLLGPMLGLLGSTTLIGEHDPLRHSVDLYSFWVPGPPSIWAGWFEEVWISYAAHNREPGASAYLGYTVIILSVLGMVGKPRRRQAVWWLFIALGFTLLALGPQLQIDGQILDIPLPYQLLSTLIPAFSITGIPGRFVVMTSLALAMLAAYGVANLSRFLTVKGQRTALKYGLVIAASILIFLEFLAVPVRLTSTELDNFYPEMGRDTQPYAILDIKWDANYLLYAQTIHQKPLVGGWLARLPEEQAAYLNQGGLDKSFLYLLLGPEGRELEAAQIPAAIQSALAERNVRYIIDHDQVASPFLEQFVGWPIVYKGNNIVVYERE